MEFADNLILGFSTAGTLENLTYCFIGVLVGTVVGILPGLGPTATLAILLPFTFSLPSVAALIMLAGIYYGAQYGGSITAILLNLPGESSSVVTCIDGYQMALQGRGGVALCVAGLGSLFAGCAATMLLAVAAPALASAALLFGPAEYFLLMVLGLFAATTLAQGSISKAFAMLIFGLLLGLVGTDVTTGEQRMTFGFLTLADGINFVPLAIGMFAIPEILRTLEDRSARDAAAARISRLWPSMADARRAAPAVVRGTTIGSILGFLPGGGSVLASFAAYALEKKISRCPGQFGDGAIEGVASPEAANNAGAQTSFIPLLTLGLPSNAIMALMAGAMVIQGIQPGPDVIVSQPALFWGLVASMFIGNVILIFLNLPLIRLWVSLIRVPFDWLFPCIIIFCCIGVFSLNNSSFDVGMMVVFGLLGYLLTKWGFEPAPLVLAFILSPLLEEYLQRSLLMSRGSMDIFVDSALAVALLALLAVVLLFPLATFLFRDRRGSLPEESS